MNKKRYQPDVEFAIGKVFCSDCRPETKFMFYQTPRRMFVGLASNAAGNSPTVLPRHLKHLVKFVFVLVQLKCKNASVCHGIGAVRAVRNLL